MTVVDQTVFVWADNGDTNVHIEDGHNEVTLSMAEAMEVLDQLVNMLQPEWLGFPRIPPI